MQLRIQNRPLDRGFVPARGNFAVPARRRKIRHAFELDGRRLAESAEKRFDVVLELYSFPKNERLRLESPCRRRGRSAERCERVAVGELAGT